MPGRGVLFALDRGDEAELLSLVDAKARVAFVANEIEERWETSWLLDMDDTWLPVHYCLNGAIGYPLPGAAPEANAIFGGHLLGISRLYTIDYKTSALVRQIAISLADIGDQALSARVGLVERVDYNGPKGPQTQAAVAEAIRELKTFYAHAAGAGRAVIFTVDI